MKRKHKYADGGQVLKRVEKKLDKAFGYPEAKPAPKKQPAGGAGAKEKFA